jgi:hypothetical protein
LCELSKPPSAAGYVSPLRLLFASIHWTFAHTVA